MTQAIANFLCLVAGHKWRYKDYSNWKKENGDHYDFRASRICSRCKQNEYLYDEWKVEYRKSPYDIKGDFLSFKDFPPLPEGKRME